VVSVGDAKRGDIGSTAEAYARAMYEVWGFDVVTVSPFLGPDTLQPFLEYKDRGIFVLCKTSNPGSGTFQDLSVAHADSSTPLYEAVAREMVALDQEHPGQIGLVTGATYPEQLAEVRRIAPTLPFLVPGIGAQQGDVHAAVTAGLDANGAGIVVNASRGVIYASNGDDWQSAARQAALALHERLEAARQEVAPPATREAAGAANRASAR
jgi:orotidine-5'-phosphate decarboxylase